MYTPKGHLSTKHDDKPSDFGVLCFPTHLNRGGKTRKDSNLANVTNISPRRGWHQQQCKHGSWQNAMLEVNCGQMCERILAPIDAVDAAVVLHILPAVNVATVVRRAGWLVGCQSRRNFTQLCPAETWRDLSFTIS
eukprot:s1280_g11.t1